MKVRSLLAVLIAALLVPAAASAAPTRSAGSRTSSATSGTAMEGLQVGGFLGWESDDVSGPALRLDGELPFRKLAPQVNLSWVGSLGYSRLSDDPAGVDVTVNLFKLVPAARFSFPLNQQVSLFADGGLGIYHLSWTAKYDGYLGFPGYEASDSETSLMMRIGGGAFFQVNEKTRLGAMIEFDPLFGDYDQSLFSFQVGAMFRM